MKTAVIIPAYKVSKQIISVVEGVYEKVDEVYVIDDSCPEKSGEHVEKYANHPNVTVIFKNKNGGVGSAVKAGYSHALSKDCDIMIKMDGDGQMDPKYLDALIAPIKLQAADYTKGNRFYDLTALRRMPRMRLFGNSILSLINKAVNGYWNSIDPTNGYTAINKEALNRLELEKIENRYFFESDMLFRLGTIRAVVKDVSIPALYAEEESNLNITKILFEFPPKYFVRFLKRIIYQYFLRDFSIATIELIAGSLLLLFGIIVGAVAWYKSITSGVVASTGTVMLSALPIILGFQLLLSFINFDIQNVPKKPLTQP